MPNENRNTPASFPAAFHGKCDHCGDRWQPDDPIAWDGIGFVHEACAIRTDADDSAGNVCPSCWLQRAINGACVCEDDDGRAA